MRKLWPLAIRNLWTRKARTVATVLAVAAAAALVSGTVVAYRSVEATARELFGRWVGRSDLTLVSSTGDELDPAVVETVRAVPGVGIVSPRVLTRLELRVSSDPDGERLEYYTWALDVEAAQAISSGLVRYGRFPAGGAADEIAVMARWAQLGDTVTVFVRDEPVATLEVVGLIPATAVPFWPRAIVSTERLQRLAPGRGHLARVDVKLAPHAELDRVAAAVRDAVGFRVEVRTADARHEILEGGLGGIRVLLDVTRMVALLACALVVWSTLSVSLAERLAELGLLRALGATRGQLFGQVLVAGAGLGATGALIGVPLGISVAWLVIRHRLSDRLTFTLEPDAILSSVAAAVLATLAAAVWPAIRAARLSPLGALRPRSATPTNRWLRWGWLPGLGAGAGVAVLFYSSPDPVVKMDLYLYVGLPLLALGAVLVAPQVLRALVWLAHWPLRLVAPGPTRLAVYGLRHDRPRAAAVACALMMAAGLVVAASATTESVVGQWDADLTAGPDICVVSGLRPFTAEGVRKFTDSPLVRDSTSLRVTRIHPVDLFPKRTGWLEPQVVFIGVETESLVRMMRSPILRTMKGTPVSRFMQDLRDFGGGDSVLVSGQMARASGLEPGDRFRVKTEAGTTELTVAGRSSSLLGELPLDTLGLIRRVLGDPRIMVEVVGSTDLLERHFGMTDRNVILVELESDATYDEYWNTVWEPNAEWRLAHGGAFMFDMVTFKRHLIGWARRFVAGFNTLNLVGLVIASLGVAAAMLSSVIARGREIAVMRWLGMTRGQSRRMVFVESALVGLAGAVMAVGLGLWTAHGEMQVLCDLFGFEPRLIVPVTWIVLVVVGTTTVAVLAATVAALRAAAADTRALTVGE